MTLLSGGDDVVLHEDVVASGSDCIDDDISLAESGDGTLSYIVNSPHCEAILSRT